MLLFYVEGRNTQDLDLIMALCSLEKLPELVRSSQDRFFVWATFGELLINILLTQNPLFAKVRDRYVNRQRFLNRELPLATVEGLILLKLYALPSLYRQGNFARVSLYENDITTLIHYYRPDLEKLLNELTPDLDLPDLEEVRKAVVELQERANRFQ